ncbi:RING finger protein nenya-like [Zeugodacus cucurbitae]|uniref:RING finger protein nenya-like n=1 Tax=Zeugodacus cucurbitae TaxID=28588 RepID=UPI0010A7436E|nr:RING finger protein nenya-like [Zeugodacus cucurbitae]
MAINLFLSVYFKHKVGKTSLLVTMFKYSCNKCFLPKTVDNPNKFYFSTCGHIFCQRCSPKGRCHICKAPYVARIIDVNMSKSMAIYFESAVNAYNRFQQIMHFQTMQDSLLAHYYVTKLPHKIQAAQKKLNGMMRIDENLNEKLAHESERIDKLKAYLAAKKRWSEEWNSQRHQRPPRGRSSTVSTYRKHSSEHLRPRTPTISTVSDLTMSSENCTKSTNSSIQSDSFLHHTRNDFTI